MLAATLAIIMAIDFDASIAKHPDARQCFMQLLEISGHGRFATERAAFLVWREGDRYDCVLWPASRMFQSAKWNGAWPENTAAIVHTHPMRSPEPSAQDTAEARRLGIPIFVLTPQRWTLVRSDGSAAPVFDDRNDRVENRIDE